MGLYGAEAAARHYFHKPADALNPEEAVRLAAALPDPLGWSPRAGRRLLARGAAIHAAIAACKTDEVGLMLDDDVREALGEIVEINVISHSLGIEVRQNEDLINDILVQKNTQLPTAASRVYRTRAENQPRVRVKVLQGEAPQADYRARDIRFDGFRTSYVAWRRAEELGTVVLHMPGRHNVLHSLATLAVADRPDASSRRDQRRPDESEGDLPSWPPTGPMGSSRSGGG